MNTSRRLAGLARRSAPTLLTWAALAWLALPCTAFAQADATYPAKPIRIIVGFGAGGGNDLMARIIGQKLAENVGQAVVVENRTGAGGRLAIEYL